MRRTSIHALAAIAAVGLLAACGGTSPSAGGDLPNAPSEVRSEAGAGYVTVRWEHDGENVASFEVSREAVAASGVVTTLLRTAGDPFGPGEAVEELLAPAPANETRAVSSRLATAATPVGTAPADARRFVDEDVVPGTKYRYFVAAVAPGGGTSESTAQIGDAVTPAPEGTEPGDNPDPDRYLAARVLDEAGQAVENAAVSFIGMRTGDRYPSRFFGRTDATGVALLGDVQDPYDDPGTYAGWLFVQPDYRQEGSFQVLEAAATLPGTITADPRADGLVEMAVSTVAGADPRPTSVQFGVPIDGQTTFIRSFFLASFPADVRLTPGRYPIIVTDRDEPQGHYWDEVDATEPGAYTFDTSQAEASLLEVVPVVPDGTFVNGSVCPRADGDVRVRTSYCLQTGEIQMTPQVYDFGVYVRIDDTVGVEWEYRIALDDVDLRPAGSVRLVEVAGSATLAYETQNATYAPGDVVSFTGRLVDEYGYALSSLRNDMSGESENVLATVTVTDPDDVVVSLARHQLYRLFSEYDNGVPLDAAAPAGTYRVEVILDTGPLAGELVAIDTFDVVAD